MLITIVRFPSFGVDSSSSTLPPSSDHTDMACVLHEHNTQHYAKRSGSACIVNFVSLFSADINPSFKQYTIQNRIEKNVGQSPSLMQSNMVNPTSQETGEKCRILRVVG